MQGSDIVPRQRDSIVRWLWLLNQDFEYLPETFAVAVSILDRLLSLVKVIDEVLTVPPHRDLMCVRQSLDAWNLPCMIS